VADLDGSAGAAFEAVYADADWQGGTTVRFTGGLVDTRMGRDLTSPSKAGASQTASGPDPCSYRNYDPPEGLSTVTSPTQFLAGARLSKS
jgi:hypothetical protein